MSLPLVASTTCLLDHGKSIIQQPKSVPLKGLTKKRSDLQIDHELQIDGHKLWQDDIDCVEIKGMPIVQEHVFFHRQSKTLIVTDFLFYLPHSTGFTSFYAWLNGVKGTVSTPFYLNRESKIRLPFQRRLKKCES